MDCVVPLKSEFDRAPTPSLTPPKPEFSKAVNHAVNFLPTMVPHSYPQYMSDMNSQHHTSNHTDTTVSTVQEKNPNQVTSYDAKGKIQFCVGEN